MNVKGEILLKEMGPTVLSLQNEGMKIHVYNSHHKKSRYIF